MSKKMLRNTNIKKNTNSIIQPRQLGHGIGGVIGHRTRFGFTRQTSKHIAETKFDGTQVESQGDDNTLVECGLTTKSVIPCIPIGQCFVRLSGA